MTKEETLKRLRDRLTALRWWLRENQSNLPYVVGMSEAVRVEIDFLNDLVREMKDGKEGS